MKRIRMALDESLVQELDRAAQALGTTRSAFIGDALREALGCLRGRELERQYRAGYEKKPGRPAEISDYLADLIAEVGPRLHLNSGALPPLRDAPHGRRVEPSCLVLVLDPDGVSRPAEWFQSDQPWMGDRN